MKSFIVVFSVILLLLNFACQKTEVKNKNPPDLSNSNNQIIPFFHYDEIEYYHKDMEYNSMGMESYFNENIKSDLDSLKFKVAVGEIPEDLIDSTFVKDLKKIGYSKINLSIEKQKGLGEVFTYRVRNSEPKDAVKPIFYDILIFRDKNKIVGIAKLSIKNLQSRIVGLRNPVENFPTNDEHKKLERILYR